MKRKRLHFLEKLSIIDQNNESHTKSQKGMISGFSVQERYWDKF